MKKTFFSLWLLLFFCFFGRAQQNALWKNFATPPDSVKPSIYYYWLSDNISAEGVQKDIEAMAKVGIGRAFIGNIGLEETPYGKVKLFSEAWWKVMTAALRTATKEGVAIGLFNGPGWSQSGGPWIKPDESMRYLYSKEWTVTGGRQLQQKLTVDKPDFQNIAVLAFPQPAADDDVLARHNPIVTSPDNIPDLNNTVDNDTTTSAFFPSSLSDSSVITIDITTHDLFAARSLLMYMAPHPVEATVELQAEHNGSFQTVSHFDVNRSNPQKNVGFIPYAPIAISFEPVATMKYRLIFSHISGEGGISEIRLSGAPRIERFEEKQLAKMFQTPHPMWNEYQWAPQKETKDTNLVINPSRVIDISRYLSTDETLNWNVPAGKWVIVRYGMVPTGVTNAPASPEGTGLEVDKMNKNAVADHFNAFVGKIQKRIPAADARSLQFVVADSYETGSENWTDGMRTEFKNKYGYDPLPWLPVMTGRVVHSADESNRFLWDLRRMIADKIAYDYVGGLRDVSHRHGLKIWLENYGHWGFPSEFLMYGGQSDEVGGEFWNEGDLGSIECRAASSAAHIYGKTKVSAESFTAGGLTYARYPAILKKRGDWSFTEGINNTLLHVFVEQPYEDRNPGVNAGFGTEFNRKNTWFFLGKAFIDYERRCNFLLQQGQPVDDIAYFIGEDAPKMTGIQSPELPAGYQFDYINAEVIEKRLQVKEGKLILPEGVSYRMMVLPPLETMRPELLARIKQLVYEGAVVLGSAPTHSPSLRNYPEADKQVKEMAGTLWGDADAVHTHVAHYGKGIILNGITMPEALSLIGLKPDVSIAAGQPVVYTHRHTDSADIYFISNQSDTTIQLQPAFRVTGRQPEWWDPVTGSSRLLPDFVMKNSTTIIPLKLKAFQSGFILFRHKTVAKSSSENNFPDNKKILQLTAPWMVSFDTASRGPAAPVVFKTLSDWSKNEDERIKDYSGTAIYRTVFTVKNLPVHEQLFLNLGNVKVMARVKLNGKTVGTVWTAPWQADVTREIKPGRNSLEIEVVNTWVNRLIGDSKLPPAERKTWVNVNPYDKDSPYEPSGLMGSVTLESVKYTGYTMAQP